MSESPATLALIHQVAKSVDALRADVATQTATSSREHAETLQQVQALDQRLGLIETREESERKRAEELRSLRATVCREARTTVFGVAGAAGAIVGVLVATGVLG